MNLTSTRSQDPCLLCSGLSSSVRSSCRGGGTSCLPKETLPAKAGSFAADRRVRGSRLRPPGLAAGQVSFAGAEGLREPSVGGWPVAGASPCSALILLSSPRNFSGCQSWALPAPCRPDQTQTRRLEGSPGGRGPQLGPRARERDPQRRPALCIEALLACHFGRGELLRLEKRP